MFEQPGFHHDVHQPYRRRLHGDAAEAGGVDMGRVAATARPLDVEQHIVGTGIVRLPICPDKVEEFLVEEAVLNVRVLDRRPLREIATENRRKEHVPCGRKAFRQTARGSCDDFFGRLEMLGQDQRPGAVFPHNVQHAAMLIFAIGIFDDLGRRHGPELGGHVNSPEYLQLPAAF